MNDPLEPRRLSFEARARSHPTKLRQLRLAAALGAGTLG